MNEQRERGFLVVISGPSGVGKGTVCREVLRIQQGIEYSVSATTRAPRAGEKNGINYFFYSQEEFNELIEKDAFLEWAKVFDNFYGTLENHVDDILTRGKDCILEIDVQGALQVKKKRPDGIYIFILPPSMNELARRLTTRGTESKNQILKRLHEAEKEIKYMDYYDYLIVNDNLLDASEKLKSIIIAERCRVSRAENNIIQEVYY